MDSTSGCTNTGAGLASSLRLAGTGTQQPLWHELSRLDMPVLVVTGELDAKFTALGEALATAIGPNASHAVVPGAGHAPHLQLPVLVGDLGPRRQLAVGAGAGERPGAAHATAPQPEGHGEQARRRPTGAGRWPPVRAAGPDPTRRWRPTGPAATTRGRASSGRKATAGRTAWWPATDQSAHASTPTNGRPMQPRRPAGGPAPDPDGQRVLAALGIGGDVPQVVGQEERGGQQPHGGGSEPHHRFVDAQRLHVEGAHRGHQSEEHEHEQLAQAGVAVGAWAPGVEPTGGQARRSDQEDPPRGGPGQRQPDHGGHPEGRPARPA